MIDVKIPTVAELVEIALEAGEFFDRLGPDTSTLVAASVATGIAVDTWCHDNNAPLSAVPAAYWEQVMRDLLIWAAEDASVRAADARAEADALADAIEAGDVTAEGEWIPYATCRSV